MISSAEFGSIALTISVLLFSAHAFGYLLERLRQPRLVGEILAGVMLGPFVLGRLAPSVFDKLFGGSAAVNKTEIVLNLMFWIGLVLLMFIAGSEARRLLARENRKATAWILGLGTPMPFFLTLGLGLASVIPVETLMGPAGQKTSTLLVLAVAVAVTSIPVISRIFHDLGILQTRFASLILGASVLEDIILWGVVGVATALVHSAAPLSPAARGIGMDIGVALLYMGMGLLWAPALLRRLHDSRWNLVARASPAGYALFILFAYAALAAVLGVNLVFAAFLAGFGLVGGMSGSERERFADPLEAIVKFSRALFIPIYFLQVGRQLIWGREFSFPMLIVFLVGSSILCLFSVGLAARLAGFRGLDLLNVAVVANARGGPGIVLASVAYDSGIINVAFYTTLVLTAVLTSQAAGAWLRFVLGKGWPLLSEAAPA